MFTNALILIRHIVLTMSLKSPCFGKGGLVYVGGFWFNQHIKVKMTRTAVPTAPVVYGSRADGIHLTSGVADVVLAPFLLPFLLLETSSLGSFPLKTI